jgi:drug/metabolite transporter (DMT)-like permease
MLGGPARIIELLSDGRAVAAVAVLAVMSTVIPFAAFLKALHLIEATKASVTSTIEPVIAGVAAWFIFGEHLGVLQLLGGSLVIAAVVLSQVRTRVPPEMPVVVPESLRDVQPGA